MDRLFLSVLSASYQNQKLKNGTERIFLKIPFGIAPIKAAILPLNAKDNLPEKAKLLYDELKTFFNIQYDEKDSIGKRYRRQDAIGTPYCITFDYDTLKDNSVTIRNRNSMVQERVLLSSTKDYIINNVSIDNLLTQWFNLFDISLIFFEFSITLKLVFKNSSLSNLSPYLFSAF